MKNNHIEGFKVFNRDWTCSPTGGSVKQYSCPGKFEEEGMLVLCGHGMHFCKKLIDCFEYYSFNENNKVAEVVAYGDVVEGEKKCCTNKLEIIREIPWEEVLSMVNIGENCKGIRNSGFSNDGNRNSGDGNSGNYNSGTDNSGDYNSGDHNSGDYNSGDHNSGDNNSGDYNSGNRNTGSWNSGSWNTGDWNTGNWNTGDWNVCSYTSGCFNTEEETIRFFNKPSNWTYSNWFNSKARHIMNRINTNSIEDKQKWWDDVLLEEERKIIKELPNFDPDIFEQCTGIKVS